MQTMGGDSGNGGEDVVKIEHGVSFQRKAGPAPCRPQVVC
jgi:hypothetical protein